MSFADELVLRRADVERMLCAAPPVRSWWVSGTNEAYLQVNVCDGDDCLQNRVALLKAGLCASEEWPYVAWTDDDVVHYGRALFDDITAWEGRAPDDRVVWADELRTLCRSVLAQAYQVLKLLPDGAVGPDTRSDSVTLTSTEPASIVEAIQAATLAEVLSREASSEEAFFSLSDRFAYVMWCTSA